MPDSVLARLKERREQITEITERADLSGLPSNPMLRDLLGELATIDAALVQAENTKAIQESEAARHREQAASDDASFWFRRFMLSLQIGNGAGLLAIVGGALQADDPKAAIGLAGLQAVAFGYGVLLAGALPGVLALERGARTRPIRLTLRVVVALLTLGSSAAFVYAIIALHGYLLGMGA